MTKTRSLAKRKPPRVPAAPPKLTRGQLRKLAAISLLGKVKRKLNPDEWTDGWGEYGDPGVPHCILGWVAELAPDRKKRTEGLEDMWGHGLADHGEELSLGYERQPELRVALDAIGRAVGDYYYVRERRDVGSLAGKRSDYKNDWNEAININDTHGLEAVRDVVDRALRTLRKGVRG